MKGNHDYWWTTANKMNAYLKAEGFDTLHILHNNSYSVEGYALCLSLIHIFKLYFMMGLPTETMEDIEGIAETAQKVVDLYYSCLLYTSISGALVPV